MGDPSVAYELYEKGLYLDAARAIDNVASVPKDLRALRVLLESHTGIPTEARNMAVGLLREDLSSREQSLCWEAIGRVHINCGQTSEGLRTMSKAFVAAAETQDRQRYARLSASYTEALLHCVSEDAAILELPKLRQAALRAGDAFSIIEFHSLEAELKAKRGLFASATASIDVARELLERFPNTGQRARVAVIATAISIIQGDYRAGLDAGLEALGFARATGVRNVVVPALNNISYIKLTLGQLDEVAPYLEELHRFDLRGGSTEIGARDTQMMLALAQSDLPKAAEIASQIEEMLANQEAQDSYYALWHVPTRVRWLYRTGNVSQGLRLAKDTLASARRKLDGLLIARLHLLVADGLDRIGSRLEAAAAIAEAIGGSIDPSIELIAEARRVAARIESGHDIASAAENLIQAHDLLIGVGNLTGVADIRRESREILGFELTESVARNPRQAIARLSNFVELGSHVPTLANETIRLLLDCKLVEVCNLRRTEIDSRQRDSTIDDADSKPTQKSSGNVSLDLGVHARHRYTIECVPRLDPSSRIGILGVERLVVAARGLASFRQINREKVALWPEPTGENQLGLICSSERMLDLVKTIRRVATSNVTVLLTGETGVGKELFARALHQASPRSDKIFLPFNCGTVAKDLIDSQMFGHRRGAFTGALADSPGVIRSAAGGTLFLDEIGEMTLETQPKLLRFLEAGEILPLGDTKPHTVDVRIVAATNAKLDQMVAEGRFREDLYYRLNVIRINIPPLRERREEIPALVEHFLERFGRELQKPLLRVADETLEYLVLYRWPGNVRQLANEVRRMVALAEPNSVLMPAHLSDDIVASRRTIPVGNAPRGFSEVVTRIDQPLSAAVEHIERAAIQRALSMTDGNLVEAARMLGLSRKGLYLKRQRLNLG